jgi:hypothetical protein
MYADCPNETDHNRRKITSGFLEGGWVDRTLTRLIKGDHGDATILSTIVSIKLTTDVHRNCNSVRNIFPSYSLSPIP